MIVLERAVSTRVYDRAMWRIVQMRDGSLRLQKKGLRGRKWVLVDSDSRSTPAALRRLKRGTGADW